MQTPQISTNKSLLDLNFIHDFISQTYWAKGRTKETMQVCIDNSLCFGVYLEEKQIGFARVLTDFGQFAYLMDVFITPEFQGKGYALELMQYILSHESLQNVKIWRLASSDARGLYEKVGFRALAKPENMMELLK